MTVVCQVVFGGEPLYGRRGALGAHAHTPPRTDFIARRACQTFWYASITRVIISGVGTFPF